MAAMCEIEIDALFGADTIITNGLMGITRAERGVNDEGIVIAAEKDYRLSFKDGEFTKVSIEQGTVIRVREKKPKGEALYFQVPATATAKYSTMTSIIYVPPTGGILGDSLITGLAENPASMFHAMLEELFNASTPGTVSDAAIRALLNNPASLTTVAVTAKIVTLSGPVRSTVDHSVIPGYIFKVLAKPGTPTEIDDIIIEAV